MKVIFVDIDGPLLPRKMHLFSENRTYAPKAIPRFDEFGIRAFNLWKKYGDAKIVFSTYWSYSFTADELKHLMLKNGLGFEYHEDVLTPKKPSSTRNSEIFLWLKNHPEVTHWIAVDDDPSCSFLENNVEIDGTINLGRWINVNYNNGISFENFNDGCKALGIDQDVLATKEFGDIAAAMARGNEL